jgi:hypothetical protein
MLCFNKEQYKLLYKIYCPLDSKQITAGGLKTQQEGDIICLNVPITTRATKPATFFGTSQDQSQRDAYCGNAACLIPV